MEVREAGERMVVGCRGAEEKDRGGRNGEGGGRQEEEGAAAAAEVRPVCPGKVGLSI